MADNTTPTHDSAQRLNKFVALALGVSRRQADELIERGKVTVNDQPAKLGQRVTTADIIRYGNKPLTAQTHQLILLHKPVGYLCSRASQGGIPTIYELLPTNFHHLKPVGRLDKDSSGLILLTNDGDFAHQMTHHRWIVQMSEGRNRQIRRTFAALGYTVTKLHRTDFGSYTLGDIKRGEFQESKLTPSQ